MGSWYDLNSGSWSKNFVTVVITADIEGNDSLLSPALYSSTQDYINNVYKFVRAQAAKIKEPTTEQVGLDEILESINSAQAYSLAS